MPSEDTLKERGRKINLDGRGYKEVKAEMTDKEELWFLGDRGIFKFCAVLDSESEFKEFQQQERALVSYSYWIVPWGR